MLYLADAKNYTGNKPDYCTTIEPGITLAVYPECSFPFLPSHMKLVWESEDAIKEREERELVKKERGALPDDMIDVMLLIDTYNFKESGFYSGDGFCLKITITRSQLESFYESLKEEYRSFKNEFKVDEYNIEEFGVSWKPYEV